MLLTIVMFFVLVCGFAAMFGVVKFAESLIAKPRLAAVGNGVAPRVVDNGRSR